MKNDLVTMWITVAYSTLLLAGVIIVSVQIWNEPSLFVMFVPVSVLEWAFVGAVVSVLHKLAFTRSRRVGQEGFYTWLVAKPVVGMTMGAVVYMIAASGELALNGRPDITNVHFLNVLAFLGGFSDKFSIDLLDRITGGSRLRGEEKAVSDPPNRTDSPPEH